MQRKKEKTVIFEGSFNPPHLGHVAAAKAIQEILNPDRLLIVPDNSVHHHKDDVLYGVPSAQERLELCRTAFAGIGEVSDIEIINDGISYTADALEKLMLLYPDSDFIIAVGEEIDPTGWYRYDFIRENAEIYTISRFENEYNSENVRQKLRTRLGADLLPDDVYSTIIRNRFYDSLPELSWLREKVIDYLDSRRVAHVAGCESEAVRLAQRYGEDPDKAATAAILHDITKSCSYEDQLKLIEKYDIICDKARLAAPKILHAWTGAALSRDLFGISDDVYSAIASHTTGKKDMTLLEKIIYLADYIEPTRDFDGVDELRELAYENIDQCMIRGLEMSISEVNSKGNIPYKDTLEAYKYYKGEM